MFSEVIQHTAKRDTQKLIANNDLSKNINSGPVSRPMGNMEIKPIPAKRIAFMGGNEDFRAARLRCAIACDEYNKLDQNAPIEARVKAWLRIVDPNDKTCNSANSTTAVDFSNLFNSGLRDPGSAMVKDVDTEAHSHLEYQPSDPQDPNNGEGKHDQTTCNVRPTIPYIKTPVYIDYGLRVRIAPTTFINRNCSILDTPVADIVIGENCSIGPGVTIISVGHPVKYEDRCEFESWKAGSWGAKVVVGDGVWVGAGVTILPGVTIGSYSTIGAGSVVTKDIPPRCVATGNPATVRYSMVDGRAPTAFVDTAYTLEDALKVGREEGD
ncbi:hypothetical protein VPNG_06419 [Cytospora leucostoma]|uniref:Uncharacterized protein n=1 Tax=Cytospora leucostoma TaxID=1230097 RepID=A0A423WYT7_9PEZI|nr:hypothetical protein VPNG_06419 [Cytospora leucostoma]